MQQIARRLEVSDPPPGPTRERVRTLVLGHLNSATENPPAFLGLVLAADPDSRSLTESAKALAVDATLDVLGLPDAPAPRLVVRAWVEAVNQACISWLTDDTGLTAEALADWLADSLESSLLHARSLDTALTQTVQGDALQGPA